MPALPRLEELDLLTTEEVAELLRTSNYAVLRLVRSGELPAIKVSRKCYRYRRAEVQRFVVAAGER